MWNQRKRELPLITQITQIKYSTYQKVILMDNYIEEDNDTLGEEIGHYGSEEINSLTHSIIGAAMEVYNTLGRGFLEGVYKDCLCLEFEKRKIQFQREKKYNILYKGIQIPRHYFADFLVEEKVVLEIKAQNSVIAENHKQIINY